MILEASRDDFARAGAAAVDEADHREFKVAPVASAHVGGYFAVAVTDGNDQSVVDEQVGNLDGAVEQAARVEAKVEDEALDAFLGKLLHHLLEFTVGIFPELRQPDVVDFVFRIDDVIPGVFVVALVAVDAFYLDRATDEGEFDRLGGPFAVNDDLDTGTGLAEDFLDGVLGGHSLGGGDDRLAIGLP